MGRLPPDFRLNLEGFEEQYLRTEDVQCATHLSAYSERLNLEIAVVDFDRQGLTVMIATPSGKPARSGNGRIYTDGEHRRAAFVEFDPLIIRCIAMQWIEEYTHGGNKDHD